MSREAEEAPDPSDEDKGARLSDWLLAPIRASQMPPPAVEPEPAIEPEPAGEPEAPEPPAPHAEDPDPDEVDGLLVPGVPSPRRRYWLLAALLLLGAVAVALALLLVRGFGEASKGAPPEGATEGPARGGDPLPPPPPVDPDDPAEAQELEAREEGSEGQPSAAGSARGEGAADPAQGGSAPSGPSVGRFPDLPREVLQKLEVDEDEP